MVVNVTSFLIDQETSLERVCVCRIMHCIWFSETNWPKDCLGLILHAIIASSFKDNSFWPQRTIWAARKKTFSSVQVRKLNANPPPPPMDVKALCTMSKRLSRLDDSSCYYCLFFKDNSFWPIKGHFGQHENKTSPSLQLRKLKSQPPPPLMEVKALAPSVGGLDRPFNF